ncbi:YggT family protein [Anthocerotibacter panamensis]|uniref:YggT family protein n=1 Tax=Anthocerotibacter panamensis TaxID=2857077 RepID=UPI001C403F10|nr:YggT family protein [Anthocerotibacter panamensis]
MFDLILPTLANFLVYYSYIIIGRVLLSWFPNIDWFSQPWATLSQLTDPYLNLFRRFIPPIGGLDISPIVALLLLQFVSGAVSSVA